MGIKEDQVLVVDPKAQAAERLLKRLSVAVKTSALYPRQHPIAVASLQALLAAARPYLGSFGSFVARVSKNNLLVDGVTFEGEGYAPLALHLYTRKVAVFTILPTVTDEEMGSFLSVAGMDRISLEAAGGVEHLLWQAGVGNVQVIEMTLDQEQDVETLGLNAFLALIGRGRLAPREREAIIAILGTADETARLLQNVYTLAPQVFEGITPDAQTQHAFEAVRTMDRLILDEPLEEQATLHASLAAALLRLEAPLGPALAGAVIARAAEDTSAKFLLQQFPADQLADLVARTIPADEMPGRIVVLLRGLSLPERKAEALLSLLDDRARPPGVSPGWLSEAVRPHLREPAAGRAPEVPPEFVFEDSQLVVNHEEFAQRLKDAGMINETTVMREVVLTLVDLLRDETDEAELTEVADGLAAALLWMVDEQQFGLLAAVVERVRRIVSADDGGRSALAAGIIQRLVEHPLLDNLLAALWAARETPREAEVRACLGALGGESVIPLVRILGGEPRAGMRAMLCDLLVAVGREHVAVLSSFLADERWYLVRNIADILGRLQQPEAVPFLAQVLTHHEYRVRREVADALARLSTEPAQELLIRMLDDPDQRIQLRAAQALNSGGARRALRRLVAIVEAPDPFLRLFAVKAAAIEALERVGAQEAAPVLRRLVRNPLAFGRRRRALRALARRALAALPDRAPATEGRLPAMRVPSPR